MRILAFDTALEACSVAICETDRVIAHRHEILSKGHAERLVPMIELALADAEMQFQDLDLIAVTVGPGTFTGIRIGLSAARGIALTTGLRIAGDLDDPGRNSRRRSPTCRRGRGFGNRGAARCSSG